MSLRVQDFARMYVFIFLGCTPRSGTAGLNGNSVFSILRNCRTVFQSGCTILHFHQQCMRVPISPQPHQHLLLSVFFVLVRLVHVKWYITALVCFFLMTNDVDHLLICLFAICMSSLEKCLFNSFTHSPINLLSFCWVVGVFYIFWVQVPYHIYDLQIFSPVQFLTLMKSNLSIFFFSHLCSFCVVSKKVLLNLMSQRFAPFFSSKNFQFQFLLLGL